MAMPEVRGHPGQRADYPRHPSGEPLMYQIPVRCAYCCDPIPQAWSAWHVLWSLCHDCRAWQEYLWRRRREVWP